MTCPECCEDFPEKWDVDFIIEGCETCPKPQGVFNFSSSDKKKRFQPKPVKRQSPDDPNFDFAKFLKECR